jgi:ElaB/YqjD/DUF883 family membrane-anchored ribosome-binding protein
MEQEVQVTIHHGEPADPVKEAPQQDATIPDQLKELSDNISETFTCFKESESYDWLLKQAEKARNYIKKNPTQAILVSLGAGALFGLFIKKKR